MTEHDNIKELFSKGLENHSSAVRPEVWSGLQAKMAAAGITAGTAAAAKGISVLAKWLIGGAAASAVAVTTVILVNQAEKKETKEKTQVSAVNTPSAQNASAEPAAPVTEDSGEINAGTTASKKPASPENDDPQRLYVAGTVPVPPVYGDNSFGPIAKQGTVPGKENETPKAAPGKITPEAAPANGTETGNNQVISEPEKPKSRSKITYFPNFFTPNNDGDNDEMFVKSQYLSDFSVTFLNESSKVVWTSSDPDFTWDGNDMSGEPLPAGNYICMIIAKGENGELIKEYKKIQLILLR